MKVYIAAPMSGLVVEQAYAYFESVRRELSLWGHTVFSPMDGQVIELGSGEIVDNGYEGPLARDHAIFFRGHWMVSQADCVYVNLTVPASRVSIGCMFELAWASHMGKHVVVAVDDPIKYGHAFIKEAAHVTYRTHQEATDYLILLGKAGL